MDTENIQLDLDALYDMILEEKAEEKPDIYVTPPTQTPPDDNDNTTIQTGAKAKDILTEKEKRLEKLLFGGKKELIKELAHAVGESITTTTSDNGLEEKDETTRKRKPVWQDSDDEEYQLNEVVKDSKRNKFTADVHGHKSYKEYLRKKYNQIVPQPKWADLNRKIEADSDGDDGELLRTVGHLCETTNSIQSLPAKNIYAKRLKDLNRETYAEGNIFNIQFHPTSTAALVTGSSGIASIYAINGKQNEKLHNVKFENFPIRCARIMQTGEEAILGGSKNYFYLYDLIKAEETRIFLPKGITKMRQFELSPCGKYFVIAGRFGEVHLMDLKSKELIHTFKQQYSCVAMQFSNDSRKLVTHSEGPEVNVFDIRNERIEHTFLDDGCIQGKALTISPNSKFLATGSNEGVVNIYNYDDVFCSQSPRPMKIVYNLTTAISSVQFNHTSAILGIASNAVTSAVKLVHFPSATVFSNFPGFKANLGQVNVLEFSPNSGFMALGNRAGEVPLFRLKHYNNY